VLVELQKISSNDVSSIEVDKEIFGIEKINHIAIAQVIRWQLHKSSGSTSKVKTRSEVQGSGKKIYRQKGTGNARHSDKYAPQFRKGGVAHGPKGCQWKMTVPKKIRKLALCHILSYKLSVKNLIIIDDLTLSEPKTKFVANNFSSYLGKKILFIDNQNKESAFVKSISNIVNFNYLPVVGLNVYDILRSDIVFISRNALDDIKVRLL
jgi:large subunit ribosomal protein L4